MKTTTKHVPPLRLPAIFDVVEQSEAMEILTASKIASRMLWPEVGEDRSRSLYMTLALRKVHDLLLETDTEQANTIFTPLVESYLGGWQQYTKNLALVHFPSQGKDSLPERSWQGGVAGLVLLYVIRNEVSLTARQSGFRRIPQPRPCERYIRHALDDGEFFAFLIGKEMGVEERSIPVVGFHENGNGTTFRIQAYLTWNCVYVAQATCKIKHG